MRPEQALNIGIYPNPFADILRIESLQGFEKIVLYSLGFKRPVEGLYSFELNLSFLKEGVYTMKASHEFGKNSIQKRIKNKILPFD